MPNCKILWDTCILDEIHRRNLLAGNFQSSIPVVRLKRIHRRSVVAKRRKQICTYTRPRVEKRKQKQKKIQRSILTLYTDIRFFYQLSTIIFVRYSKCLTWLIDTRNWFMHRNALLLFGVNNGCFVHTVQRAGDQGRTVHTQQKD